MSKLTYERTAYGLKRGRGLRTTIPVSLSADLVRAFDQVRGGTPRNAIIENNLIELLENVGYQVEESHGR